jgi:N-formylglutamate deformylase
MNSILLHIPHSSRVIPIEYARYFLLEKEELDVEILRVTDAYTDELYELSDATRLVFPVNRLLVDPERFERDDEEIMAKVGLGAVYEKTSDGRLLKSGYRREELMKTFYEPHHQALNHWCSQRERCLIIDCHSYPSKPLPCDLNQAPNRPPFCLGTDSFHTPEWLKVAAQSYLETLGFEAPFDSPYAGTLVPSLAYQKNPNVHSIMVEVNRNLYMNEQTGEKLMCFDETKAVITGLLEAIRSGFNDCAPDRLC